MPQGGDADDDEVRRLFEEEMRGVRRLERETAAAAEKVKPAPTVRAPASTSSVPTFEIEIAGERVTIFHPSLPPGVRRDLRRGSLRPERTLDLHGCKAAEAARQVERVVEESFAAGQRCLLVITGRGLRSVEGPVLRTVVVTLLTESPLGARVLGVVSAPVDMGGTGALLVWLRKA